jgi:hypothetical protein
MKYSTLIEAYLDDMFAFGDETLDQQFLCEQILTDCKPLILESENPFLTLENYKSKLNNEGKAIIDDFILYCTEI